MKVALHIEDAEVERLAGRVAELAHESETEAAPRALADRMEKLEPHNEAPKRERFGRRSHPTFWGSRELRLKSRRFSGSVPKEISSDGFGHFCRGRRATRRARS